MHLRKTHTTMALSPQHAFVCFIICCFFLPVRSGCPSSRVSGIGASYTSSEKPGLHGMELLPSVPVCKITEWLISAQLTFPNPWPLTPQHTHTHTHIQRQHLFYSRTENAIRLMRPARLSVLLQSRAGNENSDRFVFHRARARASDRSAALDPPTAVWDGSAPSERRPQVRKDTGLVKWGVSFWALFIYLFIKTYRIWESVYVKLLANLSVPTLTLRSYCPTTNPSPPPPHIPPNNHHQSMVLIQSLLWGALKEWVRQHPSYSCHLHSFIPRNFNENKARGEQ